MAEVVESSRYSIKYARGRIDDLERELVAFVSSGPYAHVVEPNAGGTFKSHKSKLTRYLRESVSGIVADIANHLRSSLDQAGLQIVFGAIDVLKGEPVIPSLREMLATVESCFATIEKRARHFGFVT